MYGIFGRKMWMTTGFTGLCRVYIPESTQRLFTPLSLLLRNTNIVEFNAKWSDLSENTIRKTV